MALAVAYRVGTLSVPYWALSDITIQSTIVEQMLFLGTALGAGSPGRSLFTLLVAMVLLAPIALDRRRGSLHAAIRHGWWAGLAFVLVVGAVLRRDLLFYARGFIPFLPLLAAAWVHATGQSSRALRVVLVAPVWAVAAIGSTLLAVSSPEHPYYRDRDRLRELVERAEQFRSRYDLLLVHHWWMAMVFDRYATDRTRVVPLNVTEASIERELAWAGALRAVERLPKDARLALVLNDLATEHSDPGQRVLRALEKERSNLGEVPCLGGRAPRISLVCNRIVFFGPVTD